MLDQSLIKSNFIGKDGFIWWIGQIPPEDTHKGQINGGGWGNRYKVRILGYDSPNPTDLTDDDVRWAQVMLPTTAGSGAANQSTSVAISPGAYDALSMEIVHVSSAAPQATVNGAEVIYAEAAESTGVLTVNFAVPSAAHV